MNEETILPDVQLIRIVQAVLAVYPINTQKLNRFKYYRIRIHADAEPKYLLEVLEDYSFWYLGAKRSLLVGALIKAFNLEVERPGEGIFCYCLFPREYVLDLDPGECFTEKLWLKRVLGDEFHRYT